MAVQGEVEELPLLEIPVRPIAPSSNEVIDLTRATRFAGANLEAKCRQSGKEACEKVLAERGPAFSPNSLLAAVIVLWWPPLKRKRDVLNPFVKGIVDGFQEAGLILDDNQIKDVRYIQGGSAPTLEEACCVFEFYPYRPSRPRQCPTLSVQELEKAQAHTKQLKERRKARAEQKAKTAKAVLRRNSI